MTSDVSSIHISSLVIQCQPEDLTAVIKLTENLKNVEVAAHDPCGKLVVVLETETEQEILSIIEDIQTMPGVLTAMMVYHERDC